MAIFDVTVPLRNGMPTYPGDPGIQIQSWNSLQNGDAANVSVLHLGAHTGTHIDAPAHFIQDAGKIESLPLDVLIGEALVVSVPHELNSIDVDLVRRECPKGTKRVLFQSRNSDLWQDPDSSFRKDFVYLELDAARLLVQLGAQLVGIDYLSIEQFGSPKHETHLELLSNRVVIVEGLNLKDIVPGKYELMCLPLRIDSGAGDGAPARVVLKSLE